MRNGRREFDNILVFIVFGLVFCLVSVRTRFWVFSGGFGFLVLSLVLWFCIFCFCKSCKVVRYRILLGLGGYIRFFLGRRD